METKIVRKTLHTAVHATTQTIPHQSQQADSPTRPRLPALDLLIVPMLLCSALVPRILLARQIDVVTDEIVYILAGKTDLHLVAHGLIGSGKWNYNYEHPPFVKLLIGLALSVNTRFGHPSTELLAARLPSALFGTALVIALYLLGRAICGRVVALLAALCLAVSPWLVYFSALAYLDMTMTALITIAYLLLWPAIRRPRLYLLIAALMGLAIDSKYTAVLAIPAMLLFTGYYFLAIRPRLPLDQRPRVPWLHWLSAVFLLPLTFLAADPGIWPRPLPLLLRSFQFEWNHSQEGHLTFLAGQASLHMPMWTILYIAIAKLSALVTVPAACFIIFAFVRLVRFHMPTSRISASSAAHASFLLIWLLANLGMFSLLNIVVGTHYHLPIAPPIALAGATGLAILLRYRPGMLLASTKEPPQAISGAPAHRSIPRFNPRAALTAFLLTAALVIPHLLGLTTVYAADGYTSEFFQGENRVLQVAYPGYREAVQWLAAYTSKPARIGLVGLSNTLGGGNDGVSWYRYNSNLPKRFRLTEAHPDDYNFPYDYLVWPMHLLQRGYTIPEGWNRHVIDTITGGNTIYCYILARNSTTIT